jgi:tRNA(adenine34) deaminase
VGVRWIPLFVIVIMHEQFMQLAITEARLAETADEVPIGCVIVHSGAVIAAGHNRRETLQDPTAHAEIVALRLAANVLGSWRLEECTLYVTLEPCPMCAGAIVQARVPRVVYGAADPKAGACHTLYEITSDPRLNHRCEVTAGVLAEECAELLSKFFQQKRALGKK